VSWVYKINFEQLDFCILDQLMATTTFSPKNSPPSLLSPFIIVILLE